MDYKIQKEIVDLMFKENIKNVFLESWEPYQNERTKLEIMVEKKLKKVLPNSKNYYVKYIQQESLFKVFGLKKGKIGFNDVTIAVYRA